MSALPPAPPRPYYADGGPLHGDTDATARETFIEGLIRTGRLVRQRFGDELAAEGYAYPVEFFPTLKYLREHGVRHQDQIAAFLVRDKATVARMLLRLEESGLVTRAVDPANRRRKLVALTAHGRDTFRELTRCALRVRAAATRGFSAAQLGVCNDLLARVFDNITGLTAAPQPDAR